MSVPTVTETQATMFCPECGQKNEAAAGFCKFCGAKMIENQPVAEAPAEPQPKSASPSISVDSIVKALKNIPKKVKMIAAAAVALVVVISAFFIIGNALTNPAGIAKGYFKAVSSGNYEEAFKYLSLDSSDFINKKSFSKYLEEKGGKIEDLANYSITEEGKDKLTKEQTELMKQLGISGDLNESDDGFTKTYIVKYAVKGASAQNTQTIILVKNSKKKLLFFDDYDVSINNLLVTDYTVTVPQGSSASIDGVTLTDLQPADESGSSSKTVITDKYKVPKIFAGSHNLVVKNDFCEDYSEKISVSGGSYSGKTVSSMVLKETLRKDLAKKTQDSYSSIFNGAIAGKSFSSLGLACTSDSDKAEKIKTAYDDFLKKVKMVEGIGYKSVNLKTFTDRENQSEMNTQMTYSCSMDVKYDAVKVENTTWFGVNLEEKALTDRSQSIQFVFVYEGSDWVIQSVSLGYSY